MFEIQETFRHEALKTSIFSHLEYTNNNDIWDNLNSLALNSYLKDYQKRIRGEDNKLNNIPRAKLLREMLAVLDGLDIEEDLFHDKCFLTEELVSIASESAQDTFSTKIPISLNYDKNFRIQNRTALERSYK